MFINYKHGAVSLDTYRFVDAEVTDTDDIIDAYENSSKETLVASIDTDSQSEVLNILGL